MNKQLLLDDEFEDPEDAIRPVAASGPSFRDAAGLGIAREQGGAEGGYEIISLLALLKS